MAVGNRILLLTEEGMTFVLEAGDEYKEVARNDLAEMSLASPAIAGGAIYIRTETKLYKISFQFPAASYRLRGSILISKSFGQSLPVTNSRSPLAS